MSGFKSVFTIAGLLAVAYWIRRRKAIICVWRSVGIFLVGVLVLSLFGGAVPTATWVIDDDENMEFMKMGETVVVASTDAYGNEEWGDPLLDVIPPAIPSVFDTGEGTYPTIVGTHKGEIKPSHNSSVSRLYTYPCSGTGGHTESIKLYENDKLKANGTWNGYVGDWHNITIHNVTGTPNVTLLKGHKYNYTLITGSYPQIIHEPSKEVTGGTITCTSFIDANGKVHTDWIPAIKTVFDTGIFDITPSLEAEINPKSLYSGESFQTNITLIPAENMDNLFFHNTIISPSKVYYWNPDPNTYNSSSDKGDLHVKAGEIYTRSWNWTLPRDAESGEWRVLVGSYYGSNKTLYLYKELTIEVYNYPKWTLNARIAGASVFWDMNDSEIHSMLQEFESQYVNVIEADSDFSFYLNESEFDRNVVFMKKFVDEAHKYGFRVVWYTPTLEVITAAGPKKTVQNNTM